MKHKEEYWTLFFPRSGGSAHEVDIRYRAETKDGVIQNWNERSEPGEEWDEDFYFGLGYTVRRVTVEWEE